jgi:pimeloyl-ACP methyl ester carboxylesterase
MKKYWLTEFDRRAQEGRVDLFSNYKLRVEDHKGTVDLYFVALLSTKEDAIPLFLLHGLLGSFVEFLPTLELLRGKYNAETLPFYLIVPSLPGYVFSSGPPQNTDWVAEDAARIIKNGLKMLGFTQYVVQGGDVGCLISSLLATNYDSVVGVHRQYSSCPLCLREV